MKSYELEPLEINLNAPNGEYEVTVELTAHCDTVFTLCLQNNSFVECDYEIKKGDKYEKTFKVCVCEQSESLSGIKIQILTDGDLTATAYAQTV